MEHKYRSVWKQIFIVQQPEILRSLCLTLICIPPTTTVFLLTVTPWDLCCLHWSRECSNRWRNGFEWARRVSHSLETGVSFTAQIKLRYLHVIRGAEARHGDNGWRNDGLGIVRASTGPQHSASDQIISLITDRCKDTPDTSTLQLVISIFWANLQHFISCFFLYKMLLKRAVDGGWIPQIYYSGEYVEVCVSWSGGSWCVCVCVCVCVRRVEVTPLRELCPLSCCIYIEISLFVHARPKAWQAGRASLIAA